MSEHEDDQAAEGQEAPEHDHGHQLARADRNERRRARRAAISAGRFEDPALLVPTRLSSKEKALCQSVVTFGHAHLRESLGWTSEAVDEFLGRAEVAREIEALQEAYKDRAGIQERTQFYAQLKINSMVPAALGILARGLQGHVFDEQGNLKTRAPDRSQMEAAMQVLDRANVQGQKYAGNNRMPNIDARTVNVSIGGAVDGLGDLSPDGRQKVVKMLGGVVGRLKAAARANETVEAKQAKTRPRPAASEDDDG